jgi:hypothetical protein
MEDDLLEIRLNKNKADLKGTMYFELLPGPYHGRCWNDGSLFLTEETFGYIEPIIESYVAGFDHYAFTPVPASTWAVIAANLEKLRHWLTEAQSVEQLDGRIGFIYHNSKSRFAENFSTNKAALAEIVAELAGWIVAQSNQHGSITILGL